MRHNRWGTFLLTGALLGGIATSVDAAQHARGEPSWTRAQPAATWKHAGYPSVRAVRQKYTELPVERLLRLQRSNATRVMKPTQVGVMRRSSLESRQPALPPLAWLPVASGGAVARVEIHSPDALALRIGLQAGRIDDRVELRFAGSDAPGRVVAVVRGSEIKRLQGPDGLYWTPSTDGESQLIEIYRPSGVPASAVRLEAPQLSHQVANSRNDFRIIEKIGESGTCNVDTACRISELGQHFVDAKNAVAHMQFVKNGNTYVCSGTLLADTTSSSQTPYFYSANHCFSGTEGAPDASEMQAVANTLNTFWNYEATACSSRVAATRTQLAGGATYLYSDEQTDAMLVRLNEAAPAGAFFAGWTAEPLAQSGTILGIHHPKGDVKKVSQGQHVSTDASLHTVGWTRGTTEGGSSGSALFTLGRQGYEVRGGLYGGSASCLNSGTISNTSNRDHYSRFDVVFPRIEKYLAAEAVARNGADPLTPPRPSTSGAAPAPAAAPTGSSTVVDRARPAQRAPKSHLRQAR